MNQLEAINAHRLPHNPNLQPVIDEVVFIGKHTYNSRILGDGYTVDDVVEQIGFAMDASAVFDGGLPMQTIKNPRGRADRYGNTSIRDTAVFECTARRPNPELYSVIPKGDRIKPRMHKGPSL